jgi:extracellular matrix regulatory protein A
MLINVGYENFIRRDLVAVILKPESSHVKKLRQDAIEKGLLINATSGHKTRSVIVLTTGQVILSSLQTTTFRVRASKVETKRQEPEDEKPY